MDKFDAFCAEFENMTESEQVEIYNSYCSINRTDGSIYNMDELDELFAGVAPTKLLRMTADGFDANDKYFVETSSGLESFNNAKEFIEGYTYDIYECKEAWEQYFDEEDLESDESEWDM